MSFLNIWNNYIISHLSKIGYTNYKTVTSKSGISYHFIKDKLSASISIYTDGVIVSCRGSIEPNSTDCDYVDVTIKSLAEELEDLINYIG